MRTALALLSRAASRTRRVLVTQVDHLDAVAGGGHEALQSNRVVLGEWVLDGHNGIARAPAEQQLGETVAVELTLVEVQAVVAVAAELRGGDIERDGDVLSRRELSALDREHERIERLLIAGKRRPPAALVRDALEGSALGHDPPGGDLRGQFERFAESPRLRRNDHEVLNVGSSSRARSAAKDLDFRQWNDRLAVTEQVAPEGLLPACCGSLKRGE